MLYTLSINRSCVLLNSIHVGAKGFNPLFIMCSHQLSYSGELLFLPSTFCLPEHILLRFLCGQQLAMKIYCYKSSCAMAGKESVLSQLELCAMAGKGLSWIWRERVKSSSITPESPNCQENKKIARKKLSLIVVQNPQNSFHVGHIRWTIRECVRIINSVPKVLILSNK